MSNYDFIQKRKREQHLFIVEGNHEKNELLNLLLQCFPEMNIKSENIVIYGTNIYDLHARIVKEYGEDWADTDVDLPYVISKMKNLEEVWYKDNFINIFLLFDYERQDPYFSDCTIDKLQKYFLDETDTGKLYINWSNHIGIHLIRWKSRFVKRKSCFHLKMEMHTNLRLKKAKLLRRFNSQRD